VLFGLHSSPVLEKKKGGALVARANSVLKGASFNESDQIIFSAVTFVEGAEFHIQTHERVPVNPFLQVHLVLFFFLFVLCSHAFARSSCCGTRSNRSTSCSFDRQLLSAYRRRLAKRRFAFALTAISSIATTERFEVAQSFPAVQCVCRFLLQRVRFSVCATWC
jgi:Mn2+/Fe2+ NRAMP family transporter